MADLSITATSVVAGGTATTRQARAGAAATAGQAVYREAATGVLKLADNDSATAEAKSFLGIANHAAALNQPLSYTTKGPVTIGAVLTPGTAYYLSSTPGGICPFADLGTGDRVILIGHAISASVLNVQPFDTGVTL